MAQIQETPGRETITELYDRLDGLWLRYLNLLEEYTAAQTTIKAHLSSGFLSLAKANFNSRRSRYGQDYYDQRASATTRVAFRDDQVDLKIEVVKFDPSPEFDADTVPSTETSKEIDPLDTGSEVKDASDSHLPSPSPTPEPEPSGKTDGEQEPENEEEVSEPKPQVDREDPIRQFGILIPPALRSAQRSFSAAVQDPEVISRAVQAARLMRAVEMDIRKARKLVRKAEKSGEA
jgi:hypothetical protein